MRLNIKQQSQDNAKKTNNKLAMLGVMLLHLAFVEQDILYPVYVGLMTAIMLL